MKDVNYFLELANYAKSLFDVLPIEKEPQPLQYAVEKLYGKLKEVKNNEVKKLRGLWVNKYSMNEPQNQVDFIGLNTIGSLTDRFTILLIKEWCLRNKNNNPEKANQLFKSQTLDIIKCLANSIPGNAAINSKITNIKSEVTAQDWEEVFLVY